jgi:rSAM/selenodomain-associated transferase 2
MKISVIIPVLNERACLPATIQSVRAGIPDAQIITVDGGSMDGSSEWLRDQKDILFTTSARGKGPQQNAGAALAVGDVYLFLHADCRLPHDAAAQLDCALRDPRNVGGCFYVCFAERKPFSLHILALGMNVRATLLRRSFGDQALFLRRSTFEQIEGFPDWPLFEDYELVRRMKKVGRFAAITSPVTISSRRFLAHGVWRTVIRVFALQIGYFLGIAPARLKRWFADVRPHLSQTPSAQQNPIQHNSKEVSNVHSEARQNSRTGT